MEDQFVWFTCRICRRNFRKRDQLRCHRKEEHARELADIVARARLIKRQNEEAKEKQRGLLMELEVIHGLEKKMAENKVKEKMMEVVEQLEEHEKLKKSKLQTRKEEKVVNNSITIEETVQSGKNQFFAHTWANKGGNTKNVDPEILEPLPTSFLDNMPILTEQDAREAMSAVVVTEPMEKLEISHQFSAYNLGDESSRDDESFAENSISTFVNSLQPPEKSLFPCWTPLKLKGYTFKCEVCSLRYHDVSSLLDHKKKHWATVSLAIMTTDEDADQKVKKGHSPETGGYHDNLEESIEKNSLSKNFANNETSLPGGDGMVRLVGPKNQTPYQKSPIKKIMDAKWKAKVLDEISKNYFNGWPKIELQKLSEGAVITKVEKQQKFSLKYKNDDPSSSAEDSVMEEFDNGQKVYGCSLCDKQFKSGSALIVHTRRHTDDRKFKCRLPSCTKSFVTRPELWRHERGPRHSTKNVCRKRRRNQLTNFEAGQNGKGRKKISPQHSIEHKWPFHDDSGRLYCICQEISYGRMVGCDNRKCVIEWFHFPCVGLQTDPIGTWYCPQCCSDGTIKSKSVVKYKGHVLNC